MGAKENITPPVGGAGNEEDEVKTMNKRSESGPNQAQVQNTECLSVAVLAPTFTSQSCSSSAQTEIRLEVSCGCHSELIGRLPVDHVDRACHREVNCNWSGKQSLSRA